MPKDDEVLRQQRLEFYKEDVDKIDKMLDEFLRLSKARCVLLIDKDGHLVTKQGMTATYDMDTISALVAGSFAATKEMAKLLGEEEFSVLYHQGVKENIQLCLVGDRTLLTIIFDDKTTLGMVRLYANELTKQLSKLFAEIASRKVPPSTKDTQIDKKLSKEAQSKLDELFNE